MRISQLACCALLLVCGCATKKTTMQTTEGPACKLTTAELNAQRAKLIPGILKEAKDVKHLENGLSMTFENHDGLLEKLVTVIQSEQECCSFLKFHLSIEPNAGPLTLVVTGPAGTREMLLAL
jgi:hypothetical protein